MYHSYNLYQQKPQVNIFSELPPGGAIISFRRVFMDRDNEKGVIASEARQSGVVFVLDCCFNGNTRLPRRFAPRNGHNTQKMLLFLKKQYHFK